MSKRIFNKEAIFIFDKVKDKEHLIKEVCDSLQKLGYIDENYVESLLEREKDFPTGLSTPLCSFAIPHVDAENVKKSTVAFVKLRNPVGWPSMEDPSIVLDVSLLFFIVLTSNEKHMSMLASIINVVQEEDTVTKLLKAENAEEILNILERRE